MVIKIKHDYFCWLFLLAIFNATLVSSILDTQHLCSQKQIFDCPHQLNTEVFIPGGDSSQSPAIIKGSVPSFGGGKKCNFGICPYLVGGFNPFEKYARQNGSFPQVGLKIKNI